MKVIALNGSSRKDGNTAILIRYALEELERVGIEREKNIGRNMAWLLRAVEGARQAA